MIVNVLSSNVLILIKVYAFIDFGSIGNPEDGNESSVKYLGCRPTAPALPTFSEVYLC